MTIDESGLIVYILNIAKMANWVKMAIIGIIMLLLQTLKTRRHAFYDLGVALSYSITSTTERCMGPCKTSHFVSGPSIGNLCLFIF